MHFQPKKMDILYDYNSNSLLRFFLPAVRFSDCLDRASDCRMAHVLCVKSNNHCAKMSEGQKVEWVWYQIAIDKSDCQEWLLMPIGK